MPAGNLIFLQAFVAAKTQEAKRPTTFCGTPLFLLSNIEVFKLVFFLCMVLHPQVDHNTIIHPFVP